LERLWQRMDGVCVLKQQLPFLKCIKQNLP